MIQIRAKISRCKGPRKRIEVPKAIRENFEVGEEVLISKIVKKEE